MDILISACLMGVNCKYDGKNNYIENFFDRHADLNFIKICPEVEGGMSIPRKPCEGKNGKIIDIDGDDMTLYFEKGGQIALKKALDNNVKIAILKARSPSCGKGLIYDGSFSKKLVEGQGITAKLLIENGLKVFTEEELDKFEEYLENL